MIPLLLFVALGVVILVLFEWRERHRSPEQAEQHPAPDPSCCGQHLVCERESILKAMDKPVYFDDEELDAYADISADQLSDQAAEAIREVFQSLQEKEVAEWVRSLQMRRIALPDDVREEALLIVREQRQHAVDAH